MLNPRAQNRWRTDRWKEKKKQLRGTRKKQQEKELQRSGKRGMFEERQERNGSLKGVQERSRGQEPCEFTTAFFFLALRWYKV
jgi:hypothetical protein